MRNSTNSKPMITKPKPLDKFQQRTLKAFRKLGAATPHSTSSLSDATPYTCADLRPILRQMEEAGLMTGLPGKYGRVIWALTATGLAVLDSMEGRAA